MEYQLLMGYSKLKSDSFLIVSLQSNIFLMFHCIFLKLHFYLSIITSLHTVIWHKVFLSNTNNFYTVVWYQVFLILIIFKQIYLTYRWDSNIYNHSRSKSTWE